MAVAIIEQKFVTPKDFVFVSLFLESTGKCLELFGRLGGGGSRAGGKSGRGGRREIPKVAGSGMNRKNCSVV